VFVVFIADDGFYRNQSLNKIDFSILNFDLIMMNVKQGSCDYQPFVFDLTCRGNRTQIYNYEGRHPNNPIPTRQYANCILHLYAFCPDNIGFYSFTQLRLIRSISKCLLPCPGGTVTYWYASPLRIHHRVVNWAEVW